MADDPNLLRGVRFNKPPVKYTKKLAKKISALYLEGMSISAICQDKKMPNERTFYVWMRENEEFRNIINGARESRAAYFEDKAIGAAEETTNKDDVPAARLKFDAYKWGAEVNDPARYGKKTTISGDKDAPIKFIISTGFPEPNASQKHPELGSDGLIKRTTEVVATEFHEEEGP